MPSEGSLLALEALSWPAPDLHKVWSLIVEQNAPITVAQTNPDTKTTYEILNPELGLNSEFSTPVVILSGYEAMYERLLSTHEEGRTMNLRMRLLFVGQPGTGSSTLLTWHETQRMMADTLTASREDALSLVCIGSRLQRKTASRCALAQRGSLLFPHE